jgi:hypothetical protein
VESLEELLRHVDTPAAYWREMNATLEYMKVYFICVFSPVLMSCYSVPHWDLRNDGLPQLKTRDLQDCNKVGSEYFNYRQYVNCHYFVDLRID